MNSTTASSYDTIYDHFMQLIGDQTKEIESVLVISDDEWSLHQRCLRTFQNHNIRVELKLCNFHFCQNMVRQLSITGLSYLIKETCVNYSKIFKKQFTLLKHLHLLPSESILLAVKLIKDNSPSATDDFFAYLTKKISNNNYAQRMSWIGYLAAEGEDGTNNVDTTSNRSEAMHRRYDI